MNHNKKKDHTTGKKHTSSNPYTMVSKLYPVSTRMRTTLMYVEIVSLGGITGVQDYVWNLNGLFDPNQTGTGHQPRGFDQLAAFYNRYRVYHCKYTVTCQLQGTTNDNLMLGVTPSNSATAFSGSSAISNFMEAPYNKAKPYNLYHPVTITGQVDLAKLNGKTREAYMSDDTTQALVTANPSEVLVLHTTVYNLLLNNTLSAISVKLEYDVEFSDITPLPIS